MEISQKLMAKAEIYPKLRLGEKLPDGGVKPTGPHRVKLLKEKLVKTRDRKTGEVVDALKYIVDEGGVQKEYKVKLKNPDTAELHYLIQKLSSLPAGTEVILEMKKQGPRNYVEALNADGTPIAIPVEGVAEEDVIGTDDEEGAPTPAEPDEEIR